MYTYMYHYCRINKHIHIHICVACVAYVIKTYIFHPSFLLFKIWFDPVLKWEKLKYNNISEINVDPKRIWKPDIVLYNK